MRSPPWKALGAGLAVAVMFAACADIFGIKNASTDASVSDGGGGDAPDDSIPPYDANKDVITIPDANLAQCDGGVDDLTGAVFVSNSHPNRNTTGCGAATKPCSKITLGIGVAAQQTTHKVVLANDTFDEVVELDATTNGMTLEGGYFLDYSQQDQNGNPKWVPQCATNLAKIVEQGTHPEPYVVRISSAKNITLRLMSIQSRDSKDYSESVYGIQVIDSTPVTIDNVVVVAENGGDGMPGVKGGSNDPPQPCGIMDSGGATGSNAPAGQAGSFQNDGYHAAQALGGSNGEWGTYTGPTQGPCANCNTSCFPIINNDSGGSTCQAASTMQCGGYGQLGCNGPRGLGGSGGGGGGATVALFIYGQSDVTLMNGTAFETSSGGMGGTGALGGSGGTGTTGLAGNPYSCATTCNAADGGCSQGGFTTLDGGAGGSGGSGGGGGTGGGGAGGPSYLVVRVSPANLIPSSVNSINDAGPGRPGDGGGPNGATGDQASIKVF